MMINEEVDIQRTCCEMGMRFIFFIVHYHRYKVESRRIIKPIWPCRV